MNFIKYIVLLFALIGCFNISLGSFPPKHVIFFRGLTHEQRKCFEKDDRKISPGGTFVEYSNHVFTPSEWRDIVNTGRLPINHQIYWERNISDFFNFLSNQKKAWFKNRAPRLDRVDIGDTHDPLFVNPEEYYQIKTTGRLPSDHPVYEASRISDFFGSLGDQEKAWFKKREPELALLDKVNIGNDSDPLFVSTQEYNQIKKIGHLTSDHPMHEYNRRSRYNDDSDDGEIEWWEK